MKVSIVIVSYNEKSYLPQAIESCLNQDYEDEFEIIIGDDGSDDGSIDIIQRYASWYPDKIRYFVMDRTDVVDIIPSIRASNVIKTAFSKSTGEYLMVMSADDLIVDKSKIKRQIVFLQDNPWYNSCYTDYEMFWDNGDRKQCELKRNYSNAIFWSRIYVHISCFVFKRATINYILDRFCDDTGLLFSLLKAGKSKYIGGISFGYRQREASITRNSDEIELCLLELALRQDCLNHGGFLFSTLSRFAKPCLYIFQHREKLHEKQYGKYLRSCKRYENDFIGSVFDYDNLSLFKKIEMRLSMYGSTLVMTFFRVIIKLWSSFIKLKVKFCYLCI